MVPFEDIKSPYINFAVGEKMTAKPKTILITGGAKRIGAAFARHLANQDYRIILHYATSKDEAEKLAEMIPAIKTLQWDLTKRDTLPDFFSAALEIAKAPIDGLVNNASVFIHDTPETADADSWAANMALNLEAPFDLSCLMAKHCPKSRQGIIVNMLDQRVLNLSPYFTSYTVSKAGLATLTHTLAQKFAPHIRVNGIAPGPVLKTPAQTHEDFEKHYEQTPLRKAVPLSDLCHALDFLIQSPSVTGAIIPVDSGQHLGWKNAP